MPQVARGVCPARFPAVWPTHAAARAARVAAFVVALSSVTAGAAPAPAGAQPPSATAVPRGGDTSACDLSATGLGPTADERGAVLVTLPAGAGESDEGVRFRAWNVELKMDGSRPAAAASPRPPADARVGAEVRLTRSLDAGAEATSRLRASGQRLPTVWVAAADSGPAALRVRLTNVIVAAQRLAFPEPADALDEQAAALAADVCQLAAERADAARRLAELEALDRRKLAAAFELARLGDQRRVLDARLAAARRRLALLRLRAARVATPTEELTLRAERAEVLAGPDARPAAPADLPVRPRP